MARFTIVKDLVAVTKARANKGQAGKPGEVVKFVAAVAYELRDIITVIKDHDKTFISFRSLYDQGKNPDAKTMFSSLISTMQKAQGDLANLAAMKDSDKAVQTNPALQGINALGTGALGGLIYTLNELKTPQKYPTAISFLDMFAKQVFNKFMLVAEKQANLVHELKARQPALGITDKDSADIEQEIVALQGTLP